MADIILRSLAQDGTGVERKLARGLCKGNSSYDESFLSFPHPPAAGLVGRRTQVSSHNASSFKTEVKND